MNMAAETILTAFRNITDLTITDYSDADVTDKAEAYAITTYNHIMDESETITSHTTGDSTIDRAIAFLCASYVYQDLRPRRAGNDRYDYVRMEQIALGIMAKIKPWKISYSTQTMMYYGTRTRRGEASMEGTKGEYS